MVRRINVAKLSTTLRVLLSCTVFVMYSAMIRIYQDPEAPHDMYPGLESCRHIKDLARYKYDGEYLIRSDMVAQLAMLWSQSDCSRYAGLLNNSQETAAAKTTKEQSSEQVGRKTQSGADQDEQKGPVLNSANPLDGFSWSAAHNVALVVDLPVDSAAGMLTQFYAPRGPTLSSRSDDVPSPPPRALG